MTGLVLALVACEADDDAMDAGEDGTEIDVPRTCPPPEGVPTRPESVEDVVALLQALPVPVTLPCFLESLERPLSLSATTHDFSAQPASGPESPRLFIYSGPLTMSVVPTGIGRHLLEFAVDVGDRQSLKAELEFPLEESPTEADPYERVAMPGGGTTCNNCHANERQSDEITFTAAYISDALQPPFGMDASVSFPRQLALTCDPQTDDDPERCEMLQALFAHGDIEPREFPPDHLVCKGP